MVKPVLVSSAVYYANTELQQLVFELEPSIHMHYK